MLFYRQPKTSWPRWLKIGLLLVGLLLMALGWVLWQVVRPASPGADLIDFKVTAGEDVKTIGANLQAAGLIASPLAFKYWVYLTNTESHFVAGGYKFPANINIFNLTRLLTGGAIPSSEVTVRIIEGWTIRDIAQYLEAQDLYPAKEFTDLVRTPEKFKPIVDQVGLSLASKPVQASLEGYLFPDTYRVFRASGPAALVSKMLMNFAEKFRPEWRQVLEQRGYSVWQGVVLASIVEKEVASDADRRMVADIFWRRLQAGRGLEADSTVNYLTGKKSPAVSLADTKLDSPYNTYKYRGLPPGPIANPGASALSAVAWPQANDYWYFLTTADGQVIYSKTFAEHVQAKQKYLR